MELEDCYECGEQGWTYDDLGNASGGCWWKYCDCEHGDLLSKKDDEIRRKQLEEAARKSPYKKCPTCDGKGKVLKGK